MLHDFSVVAGMTDHLSCVLIYFKYCIVVISVFISIIQRAEIFIFDVNNCSSYDLHPGIFSTVNKKKINCSFFKCEIRIYCLYYGSETPDLDLKK